MAASVCSEVAAGLPIYARKIGFTVVGQMSLGVVRRFFGAFRDCLDAAQFKSISTKTESRMSLFSFSTNAAHEDLHRLKTMAKLGESLFQIQMQIEEYGISHQTLSDAAKSSHAEGNMSDNDLWIMYRRVRETELQKMALAKSERIIRVTLTGLENQATIEKMRKVLTHTVHQHRMVQDNGMLENSSERLMETFEQVSQHISQGQTVIDNIDAQNDDFQLDSDAVGNMDLANDNNFTLWKQSLEESAASVSELPLVAGDDPTTTLKVSCALPVKGPQIAGCLLSDM